MALEQMKNNHAPSTPIRYQQNPHFRFLAAHAPMAHFRLSPAFA